MGSTFDYNWGTINQAFCAGQIGMFLGGSDLYTTMIQNDNLNPDDYGITTVPLASVPTAALMGGGTLAAVNVNTTEAQRDAAVDWISYYYLGAMTNQNDAVENAKALQANKQPVGVPALPIFTKAIYDQDQTWIASYINVPTAQMAPFMNSIFSQPLDSEPAASTQTLYSLLDPVVQAVLTNKNANITSLLNAANTQVQTAIDKGE
jgi:ABC-type glycerol-3-phosphate transport system substrate-binding protein